MDVVAEGLNGNTFPTLTIIPNALKLSNFEPNVPSDVYFSGFRKSVALRLGASFVELAFGFGGPLGGRISKLCFTRHALHF